MRPPGASGARPEPPGLGGWEAGRLGGWGGWEGNRGNRPGAEQPPRRGGWHGAAPSRFWGGEGGRAPARRWCLRLANILPRRLLPRRHCGTTGAGAPQIVAHNGTVTGVM